VRSLQRTASLLFSLLLVSSLLTGAPALAAATPPVAPGDIVIVYTNDVHCAVDQKTDSAGAVTTIGYAGVEAFKKDMQSAVGASDVTLVDAGDAMQGDAIGTLSKGQYLVDIMNQVGYDVFVPGNHEFDYGMARMQELMAELHAKVISSNFTDLLTGRSVYDPYTIIDYGSKKIAYVGITTPESFTKSTPAYFKNASGDYIYGFCEGNKGQDLYDNVQRSVDAARAAGADYVIAVGHLGVEGQSAPWRSTDVIAHTTGIDAFIDGHSHTVMEGEMIKNSSGQDVLLTQTGTQLQNIGQMVITPGGQISTSLIAGYSKQDPDTLAFIANIESQYAGLLAQVIGKAGVDLVTDDPATGKRLVRSGETNLGDLCADAFRYVLGNGSGKPADIGLCNGGGIRAPIAKGDITYGDLIAVYPFNNVGCVIKATGQQILDALEMSARFAPDENGGFLQVSGMTYAIDPSIPSSVVTDAKGLFVSVSGARRVFDVKVGGVPIDPAKAYTVASQNYTLLENGDGYTMFDNDDIVVQPVILDNQILISYITDNLAGVVSSQYANPYGQGRIKFLTKSAPPGPARPTPPSPPQPAPLAPGHSKSRASQPLPGTGDDPARSLSSLLPGLIVAEGLLILVIMNRKNAKARSVARKRGVS